MRIIYLHQYFNTPAMAGGTRSYEMARRLVRAGHEVHLVTTWREESDRRHWFVTDEAGITVHWLPLRYSNHMGFSERLRSFIRFAAASTIKAVSLPGDVVFASSTPLTIAIPGMLASAWKRIPLVFEIRDLWPDVPIAMGVLRNPFAIRLAKWLERITYRRSSRIVALAPGMKEAVVAGGTAADLVTVIPNGCDFDVFGTAAGDPVTLPGASASDLGILYLGTMGIANGVTWIPELASALRTLDEGSRVRFYLIGDGQQRRDAEALAARLGVLGNTVHFLGTMPKHEVAGWLAAAGATIITYDGPAIVYRDSVSNKFFDSIAAGKPVFANYRGFATLTAEEAGAGWILDRDPAVAARTLSRIASDPAAIAAAGQRALSLAHERFGRDELAVRLESVLLQAVEDRGG